ncbi:MAG: PD-(D/E)XK nuclease family transposase [Defluviitaleaceae bacterium]|nr:PD-(D/E)XK nuclease family transposase [Defluviitaleaceae bacterium]
MNTDITKQNENLPPQANNFDEAFIQIINLPKRQYTQQEIDEARQNLALMNDRVFMATFANNKNKHIITGIGNAVKKIHNLDPIPPIEQTRVQDLSLFDVLGRGMIGDLTGWGKMISIAIEAQRKKQEGYAVRGTLTHGNAMRINFNMGEDYTEAPDVITINILDFRLPELENRKMFCSRIVRAEYESRETFLAEKYSEYYIELPKMGDYTKADLPKAYHDLWDLCCIFRAKINEQEEVIRMQAVANPIALELADEVRKAVAPNEFVNDALNRKNEMEQFREYMKRREQKAAQAEKEKAQEDRKNEFEQFREHMKRREQKAVQAEKEKAQEEKKKAQEEMIITAIQNAVPSQAIEAMRKNAGITETRLAELKKQIQ